MLLDFGGFLPYICMCVRQTQKVITQHKWSIPMKTWTKPEVREVGAAMEVTAYSGTEIDII